MHEFIAVIPARSGSKGLPGKNLRILHNHPLIAWSILFAITHPAFSRVIVTTDSIEIADIARDYTAEVPFLRSKQLSCDNASSIDVLLDVISKCSLPNSANIVLLEPTSPYRLFSDFNQAIDVFSSLPNNKLVSVSECISTSFSYQFNRDSINAGQLTSVLPSSFKPLRRQEISSSYYLDGTFYISSVESLLLSPTFIEPTTSSIISNYFSSFEIDHLNDFLLYESIFKCLGPPDWFNP